MTKYFLEISKRTVRKHTPLIKFGRLPAATAGAYDDLWPVAGVRTYLTAASTIRVKAGGNAADTAAGAGAQAVVIQGLNADYEEVTDTLITAGALVSNVSTNSYLRLDRAYVTNVGATGYNTAAITLEAVTGGTTQNVIGAAEGQTQLCAFTVPAGFTAYIVGETFSIADLIGAGNTQHVAQVRIQKRLYLTTSTNNLGSWRTFYDVNLDTDGTCVSDELVSLSEAFPEKTDVRVQAYSHTANSQITGRLYVVYVKN